MSIDLDAMVSTPSFLTEGKTYKQVVEKVRFILSDGSRWTQKAFARDRSGQPTETTNPSACCWCLLGAFAVSSNSMGFTPPPLLKFLQQMLVFHYGEQFGSLGEFNDYVSHKILLEFLDTCLQRFEGA